MFPSSLFLISMSQDHVIENEQSLKIEVKSSRQWWAQGLMGGSTGKESSCDAGDLGLIPGLGRPLEKGKATHSSTLAWRIPWTLVHGVTKSRARLSDCLFTKVCLNKEERQEVKQLPSSCWVNKKEIHIIEKTGKKKAKPLIKNVSQIPNQLLCFLTWEEDEIPKRGQNSAETYLSS